MSALLLIFILMLALLNLLFKKHLRGFIFLTLFTSLGALIATGYLTQQALNSIQLHKPLKNFEWKSDNVIILLGGGAIKWNDEFRSSSAVYVRLFEATRLYFECKSKNVNCVIITSGGDPANLGQSEAEVMASELIKLNVPSSDIIAEGKSRNTFENAKFTGALIKQKNFDTVVLATSATHMLRSITMFAFFGIDATPAPADHLKASNSWKHIASNFFTLDTVLHEYAGLIQFYFILSKDRTTGAVSTDSY